MGVIEHISVCMWSQDELRVVVMLLYNYCDNFNEDVTWFHGVSWGFQNPKKLKGKLGFTNINLNPDEPSYMAFETSWEPTLYPWNWVSFHTYTKILNDLTKSMNWVFTLHVITRWAQGLCGNCATIQDKGRGARCKECHVFHVTVCKEKSPNFMLSFLYCKLWLFVKHLWSKSYSESIENK